VTRRLEKVIIRDHPNSRGMCCFTVVFENMLMVIPH